MLDRIIMTPGKQITLGVSVLANPYYQLLGIRRKWLDQAQPLCGVAWYLVCVREGTVLGLSTLLGASVSHPSPRIGVCTICPEAGKEARCSGFEPAKALIRWLPLLRPPSFRDPFRCLPLSTGGVGPDAGVMGEVVCGKNITGGWDVASSLAFYAG